MKAAIIVGGFGTRLKPIIKEIPKVMAPIDGIPFLKYLILWLKKYKVNEIILCTGYKKEIIEKEFGNGKKTGIKITYSPEEEPLGTGGALKNAQKYLQKETFIVMNGDCLIKFDLKKCIEQHKKTKAIATINLTEALNPKHQELILTNGNKVTNILKRGTKEHMEFIENNKNPFCNSGIFIFEPEIFNYLPNEKKFPLEIPLFSKLLKENKKIIAHYEQGVYIEIGNPDLYKEVEKGESLKFLQSIKRGVMP